MSMKFRIARFCRLPRFSLRAFLLALTVICIGLGGWIRSAQNQRQAVEHLRKLRGAWVDYAHQDGAPRDFKDPYYNTTHSWVPNLLYQTMGQDYFHRVQGVWINTFPADKEQALRHCRELAHLKRLVLYSYTDGDQPVLLDLVLQLDTLEELSAQVHADWLTPQRVERLSQLPHLRILTLTIVENSRALGMNDPHPAKTFDLSLLAKLNQLEKLQIRLAANSSWQLTGDLIENNVNLKMLTIEDTVLGDYVSHRLDRLVKECPNLNLLSVCISPQAGSFAPLAQHKQLAAIQLQSIIYGGDFSEQVRKIQEELPGILVRDNNDYWKMRHFR
jgi:hypothetical protein